jgi:Spy/CpxP family protein refolding chaperone
VIDPVAELESKEASGRGELMKTRQMVTMFVFLALLAASLQAAYPATARAQEGMKDAVETFAFDLHEGMQRANLTPEQKQQIRTDLQTLRQAKQSGDRRSAFKAMMNFRRILDSGAFQPQDQQRIKQDLQAIREAKKASGGGAMGGGMGGMH